MALPQWHPPKEVRALSPAAAEEALLEARLEHADSALPRLRDTQALHAVPRAEVEAALLSARLEQDDLLQSMRQAAAPMPSTLDRS